MVPNHHYNFDRDLSTLWLFFNLFLESLLHEVGYNAVIYHLETLDVDFEVGLARLANQLSS